MKSCLLCGTLVDDFAFTCAGCGHADWAPISVSAEETQNPPEPTPEPVATTSQLPAPQKRKRGR